MKPMLYRKFTTLVQSIVKKSEAGPLMCYYITSILYNVLIPEITAYPAGMPVLQRYKY